MYANPSTLDYWPIATLVLAALTVFLCFWLARRLYAWINAPAPIPASICICQVDKAGMVVNGYCTCPKPPPYNPAPVVIDPVVPTFDEKPYHHEGVTEDDPGWGRMTPLDENAKKAILTETAEWFVVFEPEVVEEPAAPVPTLRGHWAVSLIEDELGTWDPDTADWLAPAMYYETISMSVRTRPALLDDSTKRGLAEQFRAATLTAANAVLTGSYA